jgi:hypothetical protein
MAQGATLRVHASTRTSRTVVWHPLCHLEAHELQAHAHLNGLVGRLVGSPERRGPPRRCPAPGGGGGMRPQPGEVAALLSGPACT